MSQTKMKPDILSQISNSCPPGQTDTIPSGDSVIDAAIYYNKMIINYNSYIIARIFTSYNIIFIV